ncbi:WecB/TagA/CpsF family glycosyltransferase [Motilibacter peucedani]|uniref:WecB/TagA/CpsF family glycosyltransferase n=1 Tax=Motilibacter peucedani TaxID=598650 RepID=UPI000EB4530B|nr:WecB/TagA/CpsF family glycosyltransferase [Motilibacter peucedani]
MRSRAPTPTPSSSACSPPPFRDPTEHDVEEYAARIAESGAHVVWVGLGTPRQDNLIAALTDQVSCVLVGVGAAFDFLSGAKPEAPAFLHGTGLEWVHRLLSEPRRLWRRYLVCNALFLAFAGREAVRQRRETRA